MMGPNVIGSRGELAAFESCETAQPVCLSEPQLLTSIRQTQAVVRHGAGGRLIFFRQLFYALQATVFIKSSSGFDLRFTGS
jgi:hypothetical protein